MLLRTQDRPARQSHAALLAEAQAIHEEDRDICHAIGRYGAELLGDKAAC